MDTRTRRNFLAVSTGAAAFAVGCSRAATPPASAFAPRRAVNPGIDNLRVVCGVNPAMLTGDPESWNPAGQNAVVAADQVSRTLDAMAAGLAQKPDPQASWAAIFRKPPAKQWADVTAAIKVNCNAKNNPRVAVVNKICSSLISLGVAPANIIIYDGRSDAESTYAQFAGTALAAGVIVSKKNNALGGAVDVALPAMRNKEYSCTRALAEGAIDILVNIAVNKGADEKFGKTTLTLKNHAGTFEPMPLHLGGGMDYLLAFSKSEAILGGAVARQQLCIVDSLWGAKKGPFGLPDKRLDRLVMGTFSPAVDYLTCRKIREPMLGVVHTGIERFLTDFGYQENEMGALVEVTA